jgi:hypothetical protein
MPREKKGKVGRVVTGYWVVGEVQSGAWKVAMTAGGLGLRVSRAMSCGRIEGKRETLTPSLHCAPDVTVLADAEEYLISEAQACENPQAAM